MSLLSDPSFPRRRRAGAETSRLSYRLSGEGVLVRVRTYCFPGCFTRPPGTSTRDHPHESTTSKPVVPGGFCIVNYSLVVEPGPGHWTNDARVPRIEKVSKTGRKRPGRCHN